MNPRVGVTTHTLEFEITRNMFPMNLKNPSNSATPSNMKNIAINEFYMKVDMGESLSPNGLQMNTSPTLLQNSPSPPNPHITFDDTGIVNKTIQPGDSIGQTRNLFDNKWELTTGRSSIPNDLRKKDTNGKQRASQDYKTRSRPLE